jgi:aspartate aminotransferase-like enzyme
MQTTSLFTPGPVPMAQHILAIGQEQPPYNRTNEFSEFTHDIISGLKYVFQTDGSVVLLTGSGTAAMEATILNFFGPEDNILIINGGTFGQRWCDLCETHSVRYDEYEVPSGADIDLVFLDALFSSKKFTGLLINAHETSTGHLYDIEAIGKIARRYDVFFVVDAISTICADKFLMDEWLVDVAILSSQKALALPPGLSFIAMNDRAIRKLSETSPRTMYFDLKNYLANQERGQLPYTPAIGIMMQLHQRLIDIQSETLPALWFTHKSRADYFRQAIGSLNFTVFPCRPSNALTALLCKGSVAKNIVEELRIKHNIIVAPNGGDLSLDVFRVAHLGAQNPELVDILVEALDDVTSSSQSIPTKRKII